MAKVRFGLRNVYYSKLTAGGTPTWSEPVAYKGAVSLTLDIEGEQEVFHADDISYYVTNSNNGYSGDLEMALLDDDFAKDILGEVESNEGLQVEVADAQPAPFALLFECQNDVKSTKFVFYNVTASRPSFEANTKEDTTTPDTTTIPVTCAPLQTAFGNIVRAKCGSGSSLYEGFFTTAPTVPTVKSE